MGTSKDEIARQTYDAPAEAVAQRLYDAPAADQKEMYPLDVALREVFREQHPIVTDVLGLSQAQVRQRDQENVRLVRETGFNPLSMGKLLINLGTQADVADQRGEEVDNEKVRASTEESRRAVREQYGEKDGEMWLGLAAKFVKSKPRLAALLGRRGIGSNKDVVLGVIEHVRAIGYR